MPKRSREESKEERWSRKMKKYEHKLELEQRKKCARIIYSEDESDVQIEDHPECMTPLANENFLGTEYLDPHEPFNEDSLKVNEASNVPQEEEIQAADTDTYDPQLLQALGEVEIDTTDIGKDIHRDVAIRFQKILLSGLRKEEKEELLKKYLCPKNMSLAKCPKLNPEIVTMLPEACRLRDKRLYIKQEQLGKTLSALGQGITDLLKNNPDLSEIVRNLNDAGKLLADSHYLETETRRSILLPLIDKSLTDPFKEQKRDDFLFGENLGELVKNSRGIKKTGQLIQASSSSAGNLNAKGSSSRGRQQRSGQSYRAGGPRMTSHQYQRRVAPTMRVPPPQAARWFPPHPTQAARRPGPPTAAAAHRPSKRPS